PEHPAVGAASVPRLPLPESAAVAAQRPLPPRRIRTAKVASGQPLLPGARAVSCDASPSARERAAMWVTNLDSVTFGIDDFAVCRRFWTDFGLTTTADDPDTFACADGSTVV